MPHRINYVSHRKFTDTDPGMDGTLPGLSPATLPGAPEPSRIEPFAVGEVLSNTFELKGILGAGGMGVVYEALDRVLNRPVAIKISLIDGPDFSLRHEAQALAALRHPAMVTIHGLWEHRGIEYMVMERLRGLTLEEHLKQRKARNEPFTISEVLDLVILIADGLHAIHQSGIAHRDVKPGNLMMAPGGRLVFTDFGLFAPQFERVARVAGSPEYMAPEAIRNAVEAGRAHLVDLYAFGIVAFQILVGWVPFGGNSAAEVLPRHLNDPPPDLAKLRGDTPPELVKLIRELLAKDPDERPQDIQDVVGELRGLREKLIKRDSGRHKIIHSDGTPPFGTKLPPSHTPPVGTKLPSNK
jgi:serine/threonine-protein kinase